MPPTSNAHPQPFDPWLAQQRLQWRNQLADWRAAPVEPLLHLLAVLALAAVLLPLPWSLLQTHADGIGAFVDGHGSWLLPLLFASLLWLHRRSWRRRLQRRQHDWFAAQPVATEAMRRNARRHAGWLAAIHATVALSLLAAIGAPVSLWLVLLGSIVLAAAVSAWLPAPASAPSRRRLPLREVLSSSHGSGRLWRWQLVEIGNLLSPRPLGLLLASWWLVPAGLPLHGAVIAAAGLLLAALIAAAWLRAVAVLAPAQRWLAAQPVTPWRLLQQWVALPLLQLAAMAVTVALAMPPLGASQLLLPVAALIVMAGLLQLGCAAAERRHPRRAGLLFVVQLTLLLGLAQALPPLVLLVWPLQMLWLLRRSLRP